MKLLFHFLALLIVTSVHCQTVIVSERYYCSEKGWVRYVITKRKY